MVGDKQEGMSCGLVICTPFFFFSGHSLSVPGFCFSLLSLQFGRFGTFTTRTTSALFFSFLHMNPRCTTVAVGRSGNKTRIDPQGNPADILIYRTFDRL